VNREVTTKEQKGKTTRNGEPASPQTENKTTAKQRVTPKHWMEFEHRGRGRKSRLSSAEVREASEQEADLRSTSRREGGRRAHVLPFFSGFHPEQTAQSCNELTRRGEPCGQRRFWDRVEPCAAFCRETCDQWLPGFLCKHLSKVTHVRVSLWHGSGTAAASELPVRRVTLSCADASDSRDTPTASVCECIRALGDGTGSSRLQWRVELARPIALSSQWTLPSGPLKVEFGSKDELVASATAEEEWRPVIARYQTGLHLVGFTATVPPNETELQSLVTRLIEPSLRLTYAPPASLI